MKDHEKYPEDWQQEAPLLSGLPRKEPDAAPEGYFERLPNRIFDRIQELEAHSQGIADDGPIVPEPTERPLYQRNRFRNWSIAAGLALLAASAIFWWSFPENSLTIGDDLWASAQIGNLSDEAILAHLELADLDPETVTGMMGDQAMAAIEADLHDLDQQETMDYLMDEDWQDLRLEDIDLGDLSDLQFQIEQEL